MTARARAIAVVGVYAAAALALGCKAKIPEGVFACEHASDCPHGYVCVAAAADEGSFCRSDANAGGPRGGTDAGDASASETRDADRITDAGKTRDAGARDAGAGGAGREDAGGKPSDKASLPATSTRFASLGEARSGGGLVVVDDGFELGERACASDGRLCVTGGFEP